MRKHIIYFLAIMAIVAVGCQKETSFETGSAPSHGSLQSELTGDCLPKSVNGTYEVGKALVPATNTITVTVNVDTIGDYVIYTDTVNGYFFRATGIFTTLGPNVVTLRGSGTPFASGTNNFVVGYDSTFCDIQVIVASAGVGTLAGAPTACTPITVNGSYSPGIPISAANSAAIKVNVTTAGSFAITTDTVAGIWFSFSGILPVGTGQDVVLQAHGGPPTGTTGAKTFTVKLGSSACTFPVTLAGPAVGTVNCGSAVFTGTYTAGQPVAGNTVQIGVTVTSAGAYTITTDTVNGVWFNASGSFLTTNTSVTLVANGTATAPGPFTYTVKWGTSICTFVCNFNAPLSNDYFPRTTGSNWSYEFDDIANDSLYRIVIAATKTVSANVFNIFMQDDGSGLDSSGYYRKNSGDYFEWFDVGFDTPTWLEYIMLKDNVAVNTTWTSSQVSGTVQAQPLTVRLSFKILQKDVPVSFTTSTGAKSFTNVIIVEEKIQVLVGATWTDATTTFGHIESYYAKGIGLIKSEQFDGTGASSFVQKLRRYQVF